MTDEDKEFTCMTSLFSLGVQCLFATGFQSTLKTEFINCSEVEYLGHMLLLFLMDCKEYTSSERIYSAIKLAFRFTVSWPKIL